MNLTWETPAWGPLPRIRWEAGWILLVSLFALLLATSILPGRLPGIAGTALVATTFFTLVGVVGAFAVHELGHAFAARAYGTSTRRITLTLFGGIPETEDPLPHPESLFTVAMAGPIANLALCLLTYTAAAGLPPTLQVAADITALANLFVGLTNLIPAQPLDGGRLLHAAVWSATGSTAKAYRSEQRSGRLLGSIAIVAGLTTLLLGGWTAGLFALSLGLLLRSAAYARWIHAAGELQLAGHPVKEFARATDTTVQRAMAVASVVREVFDNGRRGRVPVLDGSRLVGWVDMLRVRRLGRSEWDRQSIGTVMVPTSQSNTIDASADAREAVQRILREGTQRLFVVDGDEFVGIVTLDSLLRSG